MKRENLVKVALDELRMQMLGTQVLLGFRLQSVFQENFPAISHIARLVDFLALCMTIATKYYPTATSPSVSRTTWLMSASCDLIAITASDAHSHLKKSGTQAMGATQVRGRAWQMERPRGTGNAKPHHPLGSPFQGMGRREKFLDQSLPRKPISKDGPV